MNILPTTKLWRPHNTVAVRVTVNGHTVLSPMYESISLFLVLEIHFPIYRDIGRFIVISILSMQYIEISMVNDFLPSLRKDNYTHNYYCKIGIHFFFFCKRKLVQFLRLYQCGNVVHTDRLSLALSCGSTRLRHIDNKCGISARGGLDRVVGHVDPIRIYYH